MKGRVTKAKPPKAIGILSASLISSILEEKYSSGSFSLVRGVKLSSSPPPNAILTAVLVVTALVVLEAAVVRGVDGANALVEMRTVARKTKM